jgi:hypothetical protein
MNFLQKAQTIFLVTIATTVTCSAQLNMEWNDEIPVFNNSIQLASPWAGGINAGQVSTIDVNLDGLEDVFVFDRSGNKVMIFLNNGSDDPNSFKYSFDFNHLFPEMRSWVLLRDYNCDGRKDIFTYGIGGFKLFKNTSTIETGLQFELVDANIQSLYNFGNNPYYSNIFITSQDIPAIDDLDGDGDLDIMVFSVNGLLVEYHRNFSVELYGTCDSLKFELRNRCYGYFHEAVLNNSVTLHPDQAYHESICPPGYNVLNPNPIAEPPGHIRPEQFSGGPRHAGSTILTLDINQQLPKEIVLGDITHENLTILINSVSSTGKDSIVSLQEDFPAGFGNSIATAINIFPAGFYVDVNNDGVRDLIVGANNEWASINTNSLWYYKNIGQDDLPNFQFEQFDLFQKDMIEVGEGCTPFFVDINQDGLDDMLVGNKGYFISPGVYRSQLAYYQNTGTATNPEFTLITNDYLGLGNLGLGQGLHPTFGDLDNDGDLDMLIGDSSGRIYRFNNSAGAGNPLSLQIAAIPILADNNGNDIDPGQYSTPQLFDLDRDGLIDLVMGERNGFVHYYKNVGTAAVPVFEFITSALGGVHTVEGFSTTGFSIIQFFELNAQYYLITGTESGKIRLYGNIDDNLNGEFSLIEEMLFDYKNGIRSSVAIIDINNDGLMDLFTGNFGGGLHFFKGSIPTSINSSVFASGDFTVYPNPAKSEIRINWTKDLTRENFTVVIQDAFGKNVLHISNYQVEKNIDLSALSNGFYLITIRSAERVLGIEKLILAK